MDLSKFHIPASEPDPVRAIILRRRRQLIVHSIIYYRLGDSLVPDSTWDKWALELVELQSSFPEEAADVAFADAFVGFDGSTGYHLPLTDPSCLQVALRLLTNRGTLDNEVKDV